MPEASNYPKRPHPVTRQNESQTNSHHSRHGTKRRYAELVCKSNFSFLRGASHPEELAETAAACGYAALAITDRNTLAGVVRMHYASKACNLKLIVGAEITPVDAPPILLYASDRAAYGRLCRIITQGRLREIKGACAVTLDDIAEHAKGLVAVLPDRGLSNFGKEEWATQSRERSDCERAAQTQDSRGLKPAARKEGVHRWNLDEMVFAAQHYREMFGRRLYVSASVHNGSDDDQHLAAMHDLASRLGVPMLASNDVHYHEPQRRFLQDVLTCIRRRCTLSEAGRHLFANAERHLKPIDTMAHLFADYPDAITRTVELADRCQFSLDELRYEYPESLCPSDRDPADYLAELTWAGAKQRYPKGVPAQVAGLIEHELALISELRYEPYFLTVRDIVHFARSRDILCQGRGSAANSAVCYCLGITSVDPDRVSLLFERFVSAERNEPPDIDVDFEHERREEVFQYIYNKYGREHAGIVAEVITYRPRSAIRDVGKALGLSLDHVAALAKKHEWWDNKPLPEYFVRQAGLDPSDRTVRMLAKLVKQILGFPRHLSQHVGGFVMTRGPLCELVPIENGAMPDRTFIEWDKDDINALGILKIDCLSLGMLTAIHKCFGLVEEERKWRAIDDESQDVGSLQTAAPLALHTIPEDDASVYDMICKADTVGVFQIESRAQMSMLPRLRPRCFYDLVIEVAIVRPGPIQGGMVHPYLRRRSGEESFTYPNEAIKEVLKRTLGVPLFQEQAMRLAVVAAGFTPGEADQLRRAMGAWRKTGDITRFQNKLIEGMKANGLAEEFAQRCFDQICGFGEYGFPESHAASFALLVYVSAWLKRYYPASFTASILNSLPMGFYHPAQLVRDAREHGVTVLPVDVNFGGYNCRLENNSSAPSRGLQPARNNKNQRSPGEDGSPPQRRDSRRGDQPEKWGQDGPAIRLGMRLIKGISPAKVQRIEDTQRDRPFKSVVDLYHRSGASPGTLARLAAADGMQSMGLNRREAVWQVLALSVDPPMLAELEPEEPSVELPEMSLGDTVQADYETIGLSLNAHPISLIRKDLARLRVRQCRTLQHTRVGVGVRVAGIVIVRQRPATASGITFCTVEDETGIANLIIRPRVWEKYRIVARSSIALIAEGKVERQGDVIHVQVAHIEAMGRSIEQLHTAPRDFK